MRDDSARIARFWTLINDSLDARFSKPKRIARELIAFHRRVATPSSSSLRAFPASRPATGPAACCSGCSPSLRRPTVIFTAQQPKTEAIRSVHPALSYGDSDGDIADTHEADPAIRAIRIIRSPVSYNERPTTPGRYGEEILANSAD